MRTFLRNELLNKTFESLDIDFKMHVYVPLYKMASPSDYAKLGNMQSWNEIVSKILGTVPKELKTYSFKGRIDESSCSS